MVSDISLPFHRSDDKARRAQKKQKDSYLNAFSNKIKQNIDKYRTELTPENDHENEDVPAASTVNIFFCSFIFDVLSLVSIVSAN